MIWLCRGSVGPLIMINGRLELIVSSLCLKVRHNDFKWKINLCKIFLFLFDKANFCIFFFLNLNHILFLICLFNLIITYILCMHTAYIHTFSCLCSISELLRILHDFVMLSKHSFVSEARKDLGEDVINKEVVEKVSFHPVL